MVFGSNELDFLIMQNGQDGVSADSKYTWVKYSKNPDGSNMTDSPTDAIYIGIAYNKDSITESNNPSDYSWSKIRGDNGSDGYSVILQNENVSFCTNTNKVITENQNYSSSVYVYQGTVERSDFIIGNIITDEHVSVSSKNNKEIQISVSSGDQFSKNNGVIKIPIIVDEIIFYKDIYWTLSIQGETGQDGQSAINIVLGNESQNIPCTNNGTISEQLLTDISFSGYLGTKKVPASAVVGLLPSGVTLATNTNSTAIKDGLIQLNIAKGSNLGGNNIINGKIKITFTVEKQQVIKDFTWCKTKDGAEGSMIIYELISSTPILNKEFNNSIKPNTITFQSFFRKSNDTTKNPYNGMFIIKESTNGGATYTAKYTSVINENSKTYTLSSNTVTHLQCILCEANKISNQLDVVTVPVLSDDSIKNEISKVVSTVSGVSTKVDAVDKKIIDKIWQTDITTQINNYDGNTIKNIRDQITEQTKEIGQITTKVQDVESTFQNGLQSLTEKVSKVEQTAEGFKQEVSKTYATKTEVEDAVNNIKSLQIALSNDNHNIVVNSDGTSDYTGCSTTITMIYGTMNVTNQSTFEVNPSESITGNWDLQSYTYTVTNMTTETGYVEFIGTYGNRTVTKRFNIRKRDREQADFKIYELLCSDSIIQKTSDNKFLPKSITFRSTYKDATSINKNFDGYFKILETEDGSKYTEKYSSVNVENQKLYTPTNKNCKNIICKLFSDSGFKNELDSQTITVITDAYVDVGVRNLIRNSKTMIFNDYNLIYVKSNYVLDEKGNKLTDESGNRLTFY